VRRWQRILGTIGAQDLRVVEAVMETARRGVKDGMVAGASRSSCASVSPWKWSIVEVQL
jgi:hypothetical protein